MTSARNGTINVIDSHSVHKITSGQVVIDLQTAVKELVENSLDAGATNIEVRFKDYGLKSIEVVDNGSGIAPEDYDGVALKHHTSKLSSFEDLSTVTTFGFRGEALSSLCALSESVTVTTATASEAPMGTILEMDRNGRVKNRNGRTARQRGTTVTVTGLFKPLPVRRKELERNAKREFGKALNLLSAYALVPCVKENKGVRLTASNQPEGGRKTIQLRTDGTPSTKASVSALWGPKSLEHLTDLDLCFSVETEKSVLQRRAAPDGGDSGVQVRVRGLISKFSVSCGRAATDRQFFYINGRPCNPSKVQKAFNEVYRSFNATQSPFVVADFILPTNTCDINVSPDKRTIFLHSENNLIEALKREIEEAFLPHRSTFDVNTSGTLGGMSSGAQLQSTLSQIRRRSDPNVVADDENDAEPDSDNSVTNHSSGLQTAQEPVRLPLTGSPYSPPRQNSSGPSVLNLEDPEKSGPTEDRPDAVPSMLSYGPADDERLSVVPERSLSVIRDSTSTLEAQLLSVPSSLQPLDRETTHQEYHRSSLPGPPVSSSSPSLHEGHTATSRPSRRKSTNKSRSPSPTSDRNEPVQMVLNTSGASWNLRPPSAESTRPTKRPRLIAKERAEARQSFRSQLQNFARTGSQIAHAQEDDADENEDEDEDERVTVDDEHETVEAMDNDLDEAYSEGAEEGDYNGGGKQVTEGKQLDVRSSTPLFLEEAEDGYEHPEPEVKIEPQSSVIDLTLNDSPPTAPSDLNHMDVDSENSSVLSAPPVEIIRTLGDEEVTLRFDFSRVSKIWRDMSSKLGALHGIRRSFEGPTTSVDADASVSNTQDNAKAADALSRVIDKADFSNMDVIGQFNRGFIVARRTTRGADQNATQTDDLFIVDQHAADEKYNFETLQQSTKIESQTLFRPEALELTTADELLVIENLGVLHQNGFDIAVDEDAVPGRGQRLKLVARPVSKGTVFDMKGDLEELIDLMNDRPAGQMVRCSKARAMFAMRACRKSVMIGMPLTKKQMTSVVRHMGSIEQPWNCPHGRPTMRHLSDLSSISQQRRHSFPIDWAAFTAV
ncbi:DNA mismatch repair protein MutL [Neolentinus lepideus HHB14362 ss-1]|uniref:DNA mismatch repair protein PMS1 n=1 Tax=Neolentinus lepideus HHB14362 ss-1 TaxID=1314782 RepID=A0A165VRB8_9AGAM|nr:DNA mismatch repair protein MutL [Neolentinus lepideus HHB14362 ss-1]